MRMLLTWSKWQLFSPSKIRISPSPRSSLGCHFSRWSKSSLFLFQKITFKDRMRTEVKWNYRIVSLTQTSFFYGKDTRQRSDTILSESLSLFQASRFSPILSELLHPRTVAHLWVKIFITPLHTWTSQIPLNMGKALTGETWNWLSHKCTFCVDGRPPWVGSKCFQPIPSIKLNYIIFCHKHTEVDTTALHFPVGLSVLHKIHPNPLQWAIFLNIYTWTWIYHR